MPCVALILAPIVPPLGPFYNTFNMPYIMLNKLYNSLRALASMICLLRLIIGLVIGLIRLIMLGLCNTSFVAYNWPYHRPCKTFIVHIIGLVYIPTYDVYMYKYTYTSIQMRCAQSRHRAFFKRLLIFGVGGGAPPRDIARMIW